MEEIKLRFVCFKGKSMISKLIRFYTRSRNYSHIGFLHPNGKLIEAWGGWENAWCWSDYSAHSKGTEYELWELEVKFTTYLVCVQMYEKYANSKMSYDWLGIFGFVFKSDREVKTSCFCSEGCIRPLVASENWNTINPVHISPQRFVNLIQAAGGKLVERNKV